LHNTFLKPYLCIVITAQAQGSVATTQKLSSIMDLENAKAQMRKGVLEMCILAIIAEEEVYPSDIIARLKANDLIVVEGTLYPLLTRLKNEGQVIYSWRESNAGPPRKYFTITDEGRQFLQELSESWQQLVQSVGQTLSQLESEAGTPPETGAEEPFTEQEA
jgi:PadR family transcriptional regulator PadR